MIEPYDRKYGYHEVSIPTSLAIEGLTHTGEYSERDGVPPASQFDEVWFNVRTLVRNAIRSFETNEVLRLTPEIIVECVEEDIEKITNLMSELDVKLTPIFYYCEYRKIEKVYPHAKSRVSKGAKSMFVGNISEKACLAIVKKHKKKLRLFDLMPEGDSKCVMMTHYPTDLMSFYKFSKLALLESHTGHIKNRDRWDSKLESLRKGVSMPFSIEMLQIFGDGALFSPGDLKLRKRLMEVSEKRGWHSLTTNSKVLLDIQLENDSELLEGYRLY